MNLSIKYIACRDYKRQTYYNDDIEGTSYNYTFIRNMYNFYIHTQYDPCNLCGYAITEPTVNQNGHYYSANSDFSQIHHIYDPEGYFQ